MEKSSALQRSLIVVLIISAALSISACGKKAVVDDNWTDFKLGKNGEDYIAEHQEDEQVKSFLKAQDIIQDIPEMNRKELEQAHKDLIAMAPAFTTYGIWPKISNDIGNAFQNKNNQGTLQTANFQIVYSDFTELLNESYLKNYKCDTPMDITADDFIKAMESAGCESTASTSAAKTEYTFTQNGEKYASMTVDVNNDIIYIGFMDGNKTAVQLFDQTPYDDYTKWMSKSLEERAKESAECSVNGLQGELELSDPRLLNTISSEDLASVVGFLREQAADTLMEKYKSNKNDLSNFVYYLEMKDCVIAVSFNDGKISIGSVNRKDFFEDNYELDVFGNGENKYASLDEYVSAMNSSSPLNYYSDSLEDYLPSVQESVSGSTDFSEKASSESTSNADSIDSNSNVNLEWYKDGTSYYSSNTGFTLRFSWLDDGTIQAEFDGMTAFWFDRNNAKVTGEVIEYTDDEGNIMDYSPEYRKVTIHNDGPYDGQYSSQNNSSVDLEWYKDETSYYSNTTGCTLQFSWLDDGTIQAEFDGVTVYWFNANDAQVSGAAIIYKDDEGHEMDYSVEYKKVTIHDNGQYDGLYASQN